ncbi:MAG: phage terminase large subunit family protein [Marinobacterium sp.]|nr:phage terminase large subunit family protein [Marinobacterium sp.]
MSTNLALALVTVAAMFQPPKELPTKAFLESEYQLPDYGEYDFYNTPYFLGVALALDDPEIDEIVLMKAAQIGWTYFLLGYIFKRIVEAEGRPCPIMMLFATSPAAKQFHDEKLVTAVLATMVVAERMDVSMSRKSSNRWDSKSFPGGFLKLVGSNSPGNVKSTSKVGVGVVEEPDDTSDNVASQGDAIGLLEERLKRYIGSKLIVGGTPKVKGLSKTEERLKRTDQRQLPIVCHACGDSHLLNFDNVVWNTEARETEHPIYGRSDPYSAIYVCPHCGVEWDDHQRQENIRNTCFKAYNAYINGETEDSGCGWVATAERGNRAGFMDLNELYVCIPGTSLGAVVDDYLAAKAALERGNDSLMIKFVNQKLGLAYEYKDDNATADELRGKTEEYPELIVPDQGVVLTAGIDIQRDRVAITIRAYGAGMESWLVYFGEIWAARDINDKNDPVWTELDRLLFGSYLHASGAYLRITAASLDTSDGITQGSTYHYVRTRQGKGVNLMAIKGAKNPDAPMVAIPKKMDLNGTKTNADKWGLKLWNVGTQLIKDQLAGSLKLTGCGPARMHIYESVRPDYFDQVTGEVKAPDKNYRGKMTWQPKSGQPIEALDCEVYGHHAALVEKLHIKRLSWWEDKRQQLLSVDLFANDEPDDLVINIDHRPDDDVVTQTEPDATETPAPAFKTITVKSPSKPRRSVSNSLANLGRMANG